MGVGSAGVERTATSLPSRRLMRLRCQPSTKPINPRVAGVRLVLPHQEAAVLPDPARHLRSPFHTGASAAGHIIRAARRTLPVRQSVRLYGDSIVTAEVGGKG